MDFTGKVALVTGAGNGIGRETALCFAAAGAHLVLVDQDAAANEETLAQVRATGAQARAVTADVRDSAQVQGYVQTARETFGRIDCFFNNAGIEGQVATLVDYDEAMFDKVIGVNVKGVFLGLKHVLKVMLEQGSGAVVNTASVAGMTGSPGLGAYVTSKHAVIGLTRVAAGETAARGVRVNAVCPGPIDTRMIHEIERMVNPSDPGRVSAGYQASIPNQRYGTAREVANVVLFLCSDLASNVTGAQYVVDGGRTASPAAVTTPR
ncbi:MAG: glucose 1-dehydrogenase [Burkholderiaceae bacterium]